MSHGSSLGAERGKSIADAASAQVVPMPGVRGGELSKTPGTAVRAWLPPR